MTVTTMPTPIAKTPRRRRRLGGNGGVHRTPVSYTVLTLLALFAVLPLLVLLFNSFKSDAEIGRNPLGFPTSFDLSNFSLAWTQGSLGQGLINSFFLVTGTIIGVWICAGMAAYALARLNVPFKRGISNYFLIIISLPTQLFLVPLFFLWTNLGLYDTIPGLILIYIAIHTPFATLLLRTFLVGIPREIDEAARIDGASEWQVATRIILPLAQPGFLTVGLVTGLSAYNELLLAVIFISTPSNLPISTAFLAFTQAQTHLWGATNAASLVMILPVVILFLAMQRRFISGLAASGVKG
jgi:raffinose/stachyose/melibiose transport system permease protein